MTDLTKDNIRVSKEEQEALSGWDNYEFKESAAHDAAQSPEVKRQSGSDLK
jgi:hypothetical protein